MSSYVRSTLARKRGDEQALALRVASLVVAALIVATSAAEAQVNFKSGSFLKTTTTGASVPQVVPHGLGVTPKAIIFWIAADTTGAFFNNEIFGLGMTDGTTSMSSSAASQKGTAASNASRRMANKAITINVWGQTLVAEADLTSWDATNFTLTWTPSDATAWRIYYIAIGGAEVSAKVVNWQTPTTIGNKVVGGIGFRPDVVIHGNAGSDFTTAIPAGGGFSQGDAYFGMGVMDLYGTQWANGFNSQNGVNPSVAKRGQRGSGSCIYMFNTAATDLKNATLVSMDTDGFTVNFDNNADGTATQMYSLALRGVKARAGNFNKNNTAGSNIAQAVTGIGFTPSAVLLASNQNVSSAFALNNARYGIGAAVGATVGSASIVDAHAVTPTNASYVDKTTKVFIKVDNATPAINAEAAFTSFDNDGFTLNWTTNDAVLTQLVYLALAPRERGFVVGSFTKSIGAQPASQTIMHGLGFQPVALILWTEGKTTSGFSSNFLGGYGVTDGTTAAGKLAFSVSASSKDASALASASRRMAAKVLTIVQYGATPTVLAEADLASWDAGQFTLNWTTNNATAYIIHYIAIGASGMQAKVLTWQTPAGTGAKGVSGFGFSPDVVMHFHDGWLTNTSSAHAGFNLGVMDRDGDQWATTGFSVDAGTTMATQRGQRTDAAILSTSNLGTFASQASFSTMDLDGFTMNFTVNGAGVRDIYSLALKGINGHVGSFTKSPAFVQQAAKSVATASVAQAFPAASTTGNLIIATLTYNGASTISSVTDSKGNAYTLAVGPTDWSGGTIHTATYYASNIIGGGTAITVTATLSAAPGAYLELYQLEYTGVAVSPLDQVSAAIGTSTAPNSGSKTTTQANELIYGFGAGSGGVLSVGGTFTSRSTWASNMAEDKIVTATGSYAATATDSVSADWVAQMATFKAGGDAITGVGFRPSMVLLTSFQDIKQAAPVAHNRFGIGASDGTTRGSSAYQDANAAATSIVRGIDKTDKVFIKYNNGTTTPVIDAEANLTSLDADGFTLNWTTNDAVATEILYLALGPQDLSAVTLTSLTATSYDRGVLVEWRTGYEINNLGFNVYRAVDGVRTRLTRSAVAGSGLMTGEGVAVNAEQRYAFWDIGAIDPAAVYWLEDLDFNGASTWHGPITPVAGGVRAPVVAASSKSLGDVSKGSKRRTRVLLSQGAQLERTPKTKSLASRLITATPPMEAQWALAAQASIKIGIKRAGWYRVSQPDLIAAGLDPRVDPRTLRLFADGIEHAIVVTGAADGRFDPADAVEFYGTGVDTPYTDTRVYWLASGTVPGRRIVVRERPTATPDRTPQSFWFTIQQKDRSIYFAALQNGDAENWFGSLVSAEPTETIITVANVDRAATSPAELELTLQGVTSDSATAPDHRVSVLVNGTEIGQFEFDGRDLATERFSLPAGLLHDGDNAVSLIAEGDADISLVDTVRLSYWHTYQADADILIATANGPGTVTIGAFASRGVRLVDISDPTLVEELRGTVGTDSHGLASISGRVTASGIRTVLAFSEATIAAPAFITANRPSSWHDQNSYDYLAIAHADFLQPAADLAALRTRQGLRSAVIDVDTLYNEFSFGEKTPQALKDFLTRAKATWRPAPRYVVLIGDATIDPRDYGEMGGADFVPTKQMPMSMVSLETASDDWFVDADDDGLPDMAIGRLPVRTVQHAATMVAKIAQYEANGDAPWNKQVLFVADEDDSGETFEASSRRLESILPAGYTSHELFASERGEDGVRASIADQVADGRLIVNYQGHGSTHVWGTHADLLGPDDVNAWTNAQRLPFVVAMNCLNGLFQGIYDEESLAETLLRAPDGGAVAAWASSSLTTSSAQALVSQALYRLLFNHQGLTLGEAVAAAKAAVSSRDIRRSWIFFGDPAMRLSGTLPAGNASVQPSISSPAAIALSAPVSPARIEPLDAPVDMNAVLDAREEPVTLMDFNGDGRADLLLYAPASGLWAGVFNNVAGPAFAAGQWTAAWQVVGANLNGDARADLVFYKRDTGEWIQAVTTAAGTLLITRGTLPSGGPHALLRIGDFDGDQRDDVLIYDPDSGALTIAMNDGHGGFTIRRGTWPAGLRIQIGDFNADGVSDAFGYDIVTGRGTLVLNARDGRSAVSTSDWGRGWRVTTANLSGKTAADLLFYNAMTGAWQAGMNDGTGHFSTRTGTWAAGFEIHATDLDGDKRDDVLGYNPATGDWLIAMNAASGQFPVVTSGTWIAGLSISTGDVNADGRGDVVLYDPATGIWFEGSTVSPGVFAFGSGSWLPGASLVGVTR